MRKIKFVGLLNFAALVAVSSANAAVISVDHDFYSYGGGV